MHKYRFGMEEEYFVVNRRTAAVRELPAAFMKAASKKIGEQLMPELLQSQIEVATVPMQTPDDAREELQRFRAMLADTGREFGVGIIAAGTHPLALPHKQRITRKRRYSKVVSDLGMLGTGNALCGLHVHVEVPDPDLRVGIMHRIVPFLPLLLALSTSSPFWAGCETGLLGYRNAVNDALPRTGFPEMFQSLEEYEAYVQALVDAKIIADSTYVWWALRPSLRHPTLELRLTDCCTAIDDAVAIASLYRALVRRVARDREINAEFSAVARALAEENRWRAQRYGTDGTYVDLDTREAKPFKQLLEDTIALVSDDIAELGLEAEVEHLRHIAKRGTSAHRQLDLYHALRKAGRTPTQAMREVSKWLRICTEAGDFISGEDDSSSVIRAA
ncbi:MAG: glutamate---cysteine ligase / carboxylate-amine ligase [Alphaproteobacteria bacterium]|nr:glutamate---cysteine ligase / carboxylate-amine ligase [Alphaproteobacteria bacterium]